MNRLVGLVLMSCVIPAWGQDESESTPIEPEAIELLQAAANQLANAKSFLMRSEVAYDSVQEDGRKLEFGVSRVILVDRPDRARIENRYRNGRQTELVLDGERIWYYTPTENAYGSASQPGGIGPSLDFVARELGVPQPLSDLLAADPYQELTEGLTSAVVVGDAEIGGIPCSHVAYRNDVGDLQLWISQAEPSQIRRLVITYRNEPGQPQFWANLVEYDARPQIGPDTFRFSPPDDAERLKFIVSDESDALPQED